MIRTRTILLAGVAALGLAACDFVRFPGDGGPPPSKPEPAPQLPTK